jgi:hypothetical protein
MLAAAANGRFETGSRTYIQKSRALPGFGNSSDVY